MQIHKDTSLLEMQENAKLLMKSKWIVPNHKPQLSPRFKAAEILRYTEHLMHLSSKLQTAAMY